MVASPPVLAAGEPVAVRIEGGAVQRGQVASYQFHIVPSSSRATGR